MESAGELLMPAMQQNSVRSAGVRTHGTVRAINDDD